MNTISYKGELYPSLKKLVESQASNGVTYAVVATRVRDGWDLEKSLSEPKNKNARKTYCIDNIEFTNLKDLAKAAGISYNAAVKRSHRGWSDKEIFYGRTKTEELKHLKVKKPRGKSVVVGGNQYENLRHAFDSLNPKCTLNTVRARLRIGWSIEDALDVKEKIDGRKSNARKLTIDGETLSLGDAVNKFNVPYPTILDRLTRGATTEQAVGLENIGRGDLLTQSIVYKDRRKRERKIYVVDGVSYKSVAELASAYELPRALVYNRMRDNGWTAERAVKEDITETVEVQGVSYRSAMAAWDAIGKTSFSTYQSRKSQGLSLGVCLGLEPLPSLGRYEVNGVTYGSLAELAGAYNLTFCQLTSRLNNMSLEQAVTYQPSNGRFSKSGFDRNPELANTLGRLYFVRIALSNGVLHKIGITKKETSQRFHAYNIKVITEIKGKLRELYNLEQSIIREFSHLHYRAEDEFEGKTETFLLMDEEEKEVLNFISKHQDDFAMADDREPNNAQADAKNRRGLA